MRVDLETCAYCKVTWNPTSGSSDCPMCALIEKIDQHTESILLQILTGYYSKYIFEIDDKTAAWNKERGFSFRINRKHNLIYFDILNKIIAEWLDKKAKCKIPASVRLVGIYCRRYPDLVPADILRRFPSSWKALKAYFWHLFDIGILEFSGEDYRQRGNEWFKVISKTPILHKAYA